MKNSTEDEILVDFGGAMKRIREKLSLIYQRGSPMLSFVRSSIGLGKIRASMTLPSTSLDILSPLYFPPGYPLSLPRKSWVMQISVLP